ncbi:VOC family protein [Sinomicrobium sp. M5D2P17]
MNLLSIRIITTEVEQLVGFYEKITGLKAIRHTKEFAELKTATATLAIGSTKTLQLFGGNDVAKAAQNRTAIIEFLSKSVDDDYARLGKLIGHHLVQEPTTMPWGNRSLLFRDPDGNLVNFFTPLSPEAIERFKNNIKKI